MWSTLPPEEIERRRLASISARLELDRQEFEKWYQEECDRHYWARGQCCAGCDFWQSYMGWSGECTPAGVVSGAEVLASMGITFSSYMPPPGFPMTKGDDRCGKFRDEFDWQTLGPEYLKKIGAHQKVLRGKRPHPPRN